MNANPYEAATINSQEVSGRRSLWRIVPALFFLLLGVALVGAIVVVLFVVSDPPPLDFRAFIPISVYLSSGTLCIVSSVFFWLAKYRKAVYTALGAFAIIVIAVSFVG